MKEPMTFLYQNGAPVLIVMGALLLLMLLLFFFAAFKAAHCADEQQEWECAAWHAAHSQSNPDMDGSGV